MSAHVCFPVVFVRFGVVFVRFGVGLGWDCGANLCKFPDDLLLCVGNLVIMSWNCCLCESTCALRCFSSVVVSDCRLVARVAWAIWACAWLLCGVLYAETYKMGPVGCCGSKSKIPKFWSGHFIRKNS